MGADWGTSPWPSLRTSPGLGNCVCVAMGGIDAPVLNQKMKILESSHSM